MHRYLLVLLFGMFMGVAALAQDTEAEDADADKSAIQAEQADEAGATEDVDDSDLDEQIYEDADDDFRPSEVIPADQSIAFPTDI